MSVGTRRHYTVKMVCEMYGVARSTLYARRRRVATGAAVVGSKRGPKTEHSDDELVEMIREVIAEAPFHGEGHRKARARLRDRGVAVGKNRVLRLMRENGLLAPARPRRTHGDPAHEGTITTDTPDVMWGTDATLFDAGADGWCWFFGAIDHCTDEIVGWQASKNGNRFTALEPIRQGVRYAFGGFAKDIARGLAVRSDWGPQYISHAFGGELAWLGIEHSRSFVGEPQCNGVIERFMRTLKEQCLWLHRFESLEQARAAIAEFIERYNNEWLVERHGHVSPRAVRERMLMEAA